MSGPVAAELTEHHFSFPRTRAFFETHAAKKGIPLEALREAWQGAQKAHFEEIFAQAAEPDAFGVAYFDGMLHVGQVHNAIDLPLKWYLGSYPTYLEIVRRQLRRSFPHRPLVRVRAVRAIEAVFNYDLQAIVDAFYFDTFAVMGVDLAAIAVGAETRDLSDHAADLKATVRTALDTLARSVDELAQVAQEVSTTSTATSRAVAEIAEATEGLASGSERQVRIVAEAQAATAETTAAADEALEVSSSGVEVARAASEAMASVRASTRAVTDAMHLLAERSTEIGGIAETITGIAGQTNLLALNAAIEAARAGEQGRGFAVVAEEVRTLAEESQRAAATVAELIAQIQRETRQAVAAVEESAGRSEQGVGLVDQARAAFEHIGFTVTDVSGRITEIGRSISGVAAVAEEGSAASEQVSASTQQTSASTQQIAASVQTIERTADELRRLVSAFDLG